MKQVVFLLTAFTFMVTACGPAGEDASEMDSQKAELLASLEEKESAVAQLESEIQEIEAQIVAMDPTYKAFERNARLVTETPVVTGVFEHFVQARGNVASNTNVTLIAEAGGTIVSVPAKEGQYVTKGTLLAQIDGSILRSSIAEIQENLKLADTLFQKQKRLWEQGVGTEVQYLQAKSQVESLKARLAATQAQLNLASVRAPFNGRVDAVLCTSGQQAFPGMAMVRLIGGDDMYLQADFSESYIGSFKSGDEVEITFPSLDVTTTSKVSSVGEVINPKNRTFVVEVDLPGMDNVRPNMLAVVKLKDFSAEEAVMVPTNLIQTDRNGDFVFIFGTDEEGQSVAKKVSIERGENYDGITMVLSGLEGTELLIMDGFREVVDGSYVQSVDPVQ